MRSILLRYRRLLFMAIIWMAACRPALGEPLATVSEQQTVASTPAQVIAPGLESPEPPRPAMLDDGPRMEEQAQGKGQGIADLTWHEGYAAYKKGDWPEARRLFERIIKEYADSPQAPAAQACRAELALQEDPLFRNRPEAIHLYKTLLRDYPQSANARRAEWRLADLYLEQGWLQEAQSLYEQAMAHSLHLPFDGERALLGLGYTFMAMRKWSEAEHALMNLRKRSSHDHLLRQATLGLAHTVYAQRRFTDAQTFFDLSYRRWPETFRLDPLAIRRYALTQAALHHDASARELMLLFYNLYPRHDYAPTALLHVADSLAATAQPSRAELFYALVVSHYPSSVQDTLAGMRVAALRAERMKPAGDNWVGLTVDAIMHETPVPDQTDKLYRAMLEAIASRHVDTPLGSEALFHLGKHYEQANDMGRATLTYKEAALRIGKENDRWPLSASERLASLLKPWIEAAVNSHDDLTVVSLFHRHGPNAEQQYAHSPLLVEIADAHRRLGFLPEAGRLYQRLTKTKEPVLLESTLVGLGNTYLDQQDAPAARKVLERYRFQFQAGRYEPEVLHLLVTAMRREGDLEGLLRLCRQWLIHHPQDRERPAMYLQLAETLGQMEKFSDSALAYEEAFKAGAVRSLDTIMVYADTLSRLNRHEQAIAAYREALDMKPAARHAEWMHLQTARHWTALKQYERATVALAEVGEAEDPLINRFAASFKGSLQSMRRPLTEEEL
jgi:tetratricopeptide (TPR) repeat protein